eukprot:8498903-Ditylum_brightwellii.AAC.1
MRLTIGGSKLIYDNETASPAANLLETKFPINSTIYDANKGVRLMGIDIKDFFLQTPLPPEEREYIRMHVKYFDKELCKQYSIEELVADDKCVYCEIQKGMYGLKQAAILAYKQLKECLMQHGYSPIKILNGLWRHKT